MTDDEKWDLDRMWQKVQQATAAARDPIIAAADASVPAVRRTRWWLGTNASPLARAAAVLVVAGAALVFWRAVHLASHSGRYLAGRVYATAAGQREKISLPDGTTFVLAPGSQVRLAADYGRAGRELTLDGEAYFTVRHDAAHPFAVHAHNVVATDVGTQFDVRAYAEDRDVRVAVGEGEVRIGVERAGVNTRPYNGNDAMLAQGDVALVSDTALAIARGADVAELTGWTQGRVVFDATPLPEVARELGRWYGANIEIGSPVLADEHITATYTNLPLANVLELLAHAIGAQVEQHGRTIVLHSRGESQ